MIGSHRDDQSGTLYYAIYFCGVALVSLVFFGDDLYDGTNLSLPCWNGICVASGS